MEQILVPATCCETGHLAQRAWSPELVAGTNTITLVNGCLGYLTQNRCLWERCDETAGHFETWRSGVHQAGSQEDTYIYYPALRSAS